MSQFEIKLNQIICLKRCLRVTLVLWVFAFSHFLLRLDSPTNNAFAGALLDKHAYFEEKAINSHGMLRHVNEKPLEVAEPPEFREFREWHAEYTRQKKALVNVPPFLFNDYNSQIRASKRANATVRRVAAMDRSRTYDFYDMKPADAAGSTWNACKPLKRLTFSTTPQVSGDGKIYYGDWSIKWPKFTRLDHLVWWMRHDMYMERLGSKCKVVDHPWLYTDSEGLRVHPNAFKEMSANANNAHPFPEVPPHAGWFEYCAPWETTGQVELAHNVTLAKDGPAQHDCGQNGDISFLIANGKRARDVFSTEYDLLFWAGVEAAPFFQHWVQNVAPKIAQAAIVFPSLLDSPADLERLQSQMSAHRAGMATVAASQELLNARFPIVRALYKHLGWDVVDPGDCAIKATRVVYSCKAPPIHPYLWQMAQTGLFGVHAKPLEQRFKIVYFGREGKGITENPVRKVLNEANVLKLLHLWEGYEVVEFDHRHFRTVDALIDFFSDARVIIGPHGGALTNLVFAGCGTTVVELFPLVDGLRAATRHAGIMYYVQSTFLEQDYWMLPAATPLQSGDFAVPIVGLCEILMMSIGAPKDGIVASTSACVEISNTFPSSDILFE